MWGCLDSGTKFAGDWGLVVIIMLPLVARPAETASYVFSHFEMSPDSTGDFGYRYDENNETAGALVPAQIFYDAFYGRFHNSAGAVVFLCIIRGSFYFCGLSVTASAARVIRKDANILTTSASNF
ncbi:Amino acid permease [Citrus sinensis]|uniref:Amino acid permease n=1 Tax=Citrus sinensis TaxID=2711 RepID=A0ACB8KRT8_CITSI|nr:Amino acid permease [Citrus sinensis]